MMNFRDKFAGGKNASLSTQLELETWKEFDRSISRSRRPSLLFIQAMLQWLFAELVDI
jgi:hypothetical protein